MRNTLKLAISIPKEEYYTLERLRKKFGLCRSAIIENAIRFWLGSLNKEELVKRYELGYKRKPESLKEIESWEMQAAEAFKDEDLQ